MQKRGEELTWSWLETGDFAFEHGPEEGADDGGGELLGVRDELRTAELAELNLVERDRLTVLQVEIDPVEDGLFGFGDAVFAEAAAAFLVAPEEVFADLAIDDGLEGLGFDFTGPGEADAGKDGRRISNEAVLGKGSGEGDVGIGDQVVENVGGGDGLSETVEVDTVSKFFEEAALGLANEGGGDGGGR